MYAIRTEDQDPPQDVAHRMIQIAKPWSISSWSQSKPANGETLVRIPKEIAPPVELELSHEVQAKLKTLVATYTLQGVSGGWRVHRWQLAWFSLVLGDTEDRNDVSRQCFNEWPLYTRVDSQMFRWLRDTFLPMLVSAPAEYRKPEEDEASTEALLHESERYINAPCLVQLLLNRRCNFVHFLAKFII